MGGPRRWTHITGTSIMERCKITHKKKNTTCKRRNVVNGRVVSSGTFGFSNNDKSLTKKDRKNILKDCCGSEKERNNKTMTSWRKTAFRKLNPTRR